MSLQINIYIHLVTLFPDTLSINCPFQTVTLCLFFFPSFPSSPSLGLLGHGATQGFGCFGELHEGWLDRREVSCDLVHGPLAGTGSIWDGGGLQVLLCVWGSTSKPDAQLCRGEDGQREGVSLWQQLVLPHPSFHGAHPEDTGGAGLNQ